MFDFANKNLSIIVPHPDDETLGAGGIISRYSKSGWTINSLVVSGHLPPLYKRETYDNIILEYNKAAKILGIDNTKFLEIPATRVRDEPIAELNAKIYNFIKTTKPSILLIPFPDRHIDHRHIFEASIVASRPIEQMNSINLIVAYETLSETHWNVSYLEPNFVPNININISSEIDIKLNAMRCYESQLKNSSSRSISAIKALARFRGSQNGFEFAESFVCIRSNF